jgi:CheY-like chemotaxis protein
MHASPRFGWRCPPPCNPSTAKSLLRTLLYVEDNPANLELVDRLIARRPTCACSAPRWPAWASSSRAPTLPDVILMDINLPGISGLEAMKHSCGPTRHGAHPHHCAERQCVPRDIEKGLEAGFFRYLTKPIKVKSSWTRWTLALKVPRPLSQKPGRGQPMTI